MSTHATNPSITTPASVEPARFPRTVYAVVAGGASLAAVGIGTMLTSRGISAMGDTGNAEAALMGVGGTLVLGVLLCAVPMIPAPLVRRGNWGLVVMCVSVARTMLAMGAMMVLLEMMQLPRRPIVVGILVGTLVTIFAEAIAAVWVLSKHGQSPAMGTGKVRSL